jgi:hypothetical protein
MLELLESRIATATFIVTSLNDSGPGTLRNAIADANDHPGADLITFKGGLTGAIEIIGGQFQITETLSIKGPGSNKLTLDANNRSRIFSVTDGDDTRDSPLSVVGLTFLAGNAADSSGGAIASDESLRVRACLFHANHAEFAAGAILVSQGLNGVRITADIRGSSFVSNSNEIGSGGAVAIFVGTSVTLRNNLFADNVSGNGGGAVDAVVAPGETLLIQKCRFVGNQATHSAAAHLEGDTFGGNESTIILRDCSFFDNRATVFSGGGVGTFGGKMIVERSSFIENTAARGGGGLNAGGHTSLVIRSSQILDNAALGTGDDLGGGGVKIDMPEGGEARIIASIIASNSAAEGGGILVGDGAGSVEIAGSKITSNHATTHGGGIVMLQDSITHQSADLSLVRSKLNGNVSEIGFGGGVAAFGDGKFTMQSSQVIGNQSMVGGGLSLLKSTPSTIVGSVIAQNIAVNSGGIHAEGELELHATKILANTAHAVGGGIHSSNRLLLDGSIVSGNFAATGSGIFQVSTEPLTLKGSKVVGNFSIDGPQIVDA